MATFKNAPITASQNIKTKTTYVYHTWIPSLPPEIPLVSFLRREFKRKLLKELLDFPSIQEQHTFLFIQILFSLILFLFNLRKRERNWFIVPLVYEFISWLEYVPLPGIKHTTLAYWGDIVASWATPPGQMLSLNIILNMDLVFYLIN